jgi:hypothetical protein
VWSARRWSIRHLTFQHGFHSDKVHPSMAFIASFVVVTLEVKDRTVALSEDALDLLAVPSLWKGGEWQGESTRQEFIIIRNAPSAPSAVSPQLCPLTMCVFLALPSPTGWCPAEMTFSPAASAAASSALSHLQQLGVTRISNAAS